jgi:hypothetical protein
MSRSFVGSPCFRSMESMRIPTSADSSSDRHVFFGGSPLIMTRRYSSGAVASGTPEEPVLNS